LDKTKINSISRNQKGETVDLYFDAKVADPYRWLEDDRSAETAAWVEAENKVTYGYLNQIPFAMH
jgi:prolyl oligopeptidase